MHHGGVYGEKAKYCVNVQIKMDLTVITFKVKSLSLIQVLLSSHLLYWQGVTAIKI